jgi:hypothetical protein
MLFLVSSCVGVMIASEGETVDCVKDRLLMYESSKFYSLSSAEKEIEELSLLRLY